MFWDSLTIYLLHLLSFLIIMECKNCHSPAYHKAWQTRWMQRYRCKSCGFYFTETISPRQWSTKHKMDAIRLYLSWLGLRPIGKILDYNNVTILQWIRQSGWGLKDMHKTYQQEGGKTITITRDQLHRYLQNNPPIQYGWLSIDKETDLLIVPSP